MPLQQYTVQVLLASNSARRRELIKLSGWDVTVAVPQVDETPRIKEPADQYVIRLATEKARTVIKNSQAEYILTADTVVVDGNTIIGKPADPEDAFRILKRLRGHTHIVMTAIAVYNRSKDELLTDLCITRVPMRSYTDIEIKEYISSGDAMDKAGAYAIQNRDFHPVESFSGCFASVMGMPLCHLERTAHRMGLVMNPGLSSRCQTVLGYKCGIHEAVIRGDIIG